MRGGALAQGAYADQLTAIAEALAAGHGAALTEDLEPGCLPADVNRFVVNAVGERVRMLLEEFQLVALAFDDFEAIVGRYVAEEPRTTFSVDVSEPRRFLAWLRQNYCLTPQQADFATYQQAEQRCLALARRRRTEHVRYQLLLAAGNLQPAPTEWITKPIELNPVRAIARFTASALIAASCGTGRMLFFPVGQEIRTTPLTVAKSRIVAAMRIQPGAHRSLEDILRHCDFRSEDEHLDAAASLVTDGLIAVRQ